MSQYNSNNRGSDFQKKGRDDDFSYKLVEHIGVVSRKDNGWRKELNVVEWNGRPGKLDLREWTDGHSKMKKGVTLSEEEAEKLARMLARRFGISFGGAAAPAAEPPQKPTLLYEAEDPFMDPAQGAETYNASYSAS